ncbi:uncharacterized protein PAC_19366 [Phialocephala subalpina]|uniref:Uncharacterized protein n=1 Tax=Phialocephala subalpina TaxID=576137 RepID=A0A1L7XWQ8_9HELO|nr:uncharacterized protein PAC_19366 [Phialocephala subalpina]
MPFAELITPPIKQDDTLIPAFHAAITHLATILSPAPGLKVQVSGEIINENGIDIPSSPLKIALGMDWEAANNMPDFIASEEFQGLGAMLKPLAAGPPNPQLYETDVESSAVFAAKLTEVFRVPVAGEGKLSEVQNVWKEFIKDVSKGGAANAFCGTSLNLEEKLFAGATGYAGKEVSLLSTLGCKIGKHLQDQNADRYPQAREATLGNTAAARKKLEQLGAESFVVSFTEH